MSNIADVIIIGGGVQGASLAFHLDCGHSGTGFKTAPAVGLCMAELILDGAAKAVGISSLSPKRFSDGKLIKGNYDNIWR